MKMNWYLYTALWVYAVIAIPATIVTFMVSALMWWEGLFWVGFTLMISGAAATFAAGFWKYDKQSGPPPVNPRTLKRQQAEARKPDPKYIEQLERENRIIEPTKVTPRRQHGPVDNW